MTNQYWGTPPVYRPDEPGHLTSDHYKPTPIRICLCQLLVATVLSGCIGAAVVSI